MRIKTNSFLGIRFNYEFVLVLFTILISKSLYFESYGQNILFGPLLFMLLYRNPLLTFDPKLLIYSIFFVAVSLLSLNAALSTLTILCLRLYIGMIIVTLVSFKTFTKYFSKILLFLGIASILALPVYLLNLRSPLPPFAAIDGRGIQNFVFFGVSNMNEMYDRGFRNIGLWWEPGAFSVFMNVAFLFSILNKEINVKKYILYFLITLSISSTSGLIVFMLLSLLLIKLKGQTFIKQVSIVVVAITVSSSFLLFAADQLLSKFDSTSTKFVSFLSRYYDVVISYNLFMSYPFFGYGLGTPYDKVISLATNFVGAGVFYTSSKPTGADGITFFIAQVGFLGFFLMWPFLVPAYLKFCGFMSRFIVAISLFILFNTENFTYSLIFTVLSFYGVMAISVGNVDKEVS